MEGDCRGGAAVGVSAKEDVVDGRLTEDEKIEKFYALIRNYKEARERVPPGRASVGDEDDEKRRKRKRSTETGDPSGSSWIPAFKWEDFTEDHSQIQPQIAPANSPSSFIDMQGGDRLRRRDDPTPPETDGGGLDLRLRL